MKTSGFISVLFAFFAVSLSAPHENKLFHQHVEDFLGLIIAESGLKLEQLLKQYGEDREFGYTLVYLRSTNFKNVFHEIETLPEFKSIVDYLENAHIDARNIIDRVNELLDDNERTMLKPPRQRNGEMAANAFIRATIDLFPKEKLAALLEQKKKENPLFQDSMQQLQTKEWKRTYATLWDSEKFKQAEQTLAEHGLDIRLFIEQIKAVFGQN